MDGGEEAFEEGSLLVKASDKWKAGMKVGLAGHPSNLPSRSWCKIFNRKMDAWLAARGVRRMGMREHIEKDCILWLAAKNDE